MRIAIIEEAKCGHRSLHASTTSRRDRDRRGCAPRAPHRPPAPAYDGVAGNRSISTPVVDTHAENLRSTTSARRSRERRGYHWQSTQRHRRCCGATSPNVARVRACRAGVPQWRHPSAPTPAHGNDPGMKRGHGDQRLFRRQGGPGAGADYAGRGPSPGCAQRFIFDADAPRKFCDFHRARPAAAAAAAGVLPLCRCPPVAGAW